jgi:uncharacterized protein YoaH (UPF0181 family)
VPSGLIVNKATKLSDMTKKAPINNLGMYSPNYLKEQLTATRQIRELISPKYIEDQLVAIRQIRELMSPTYMEEQLTAIRQIRELMSPKYIEDQFVAIKQIRELMSPAYMDEQLAYSRNMYAQMPPTFVDQQLAATRKIHDLMSSTFVEEQLAATKKLRTLFSSKFMEEQLSARKVILEFSNPANLQNFFEHLTTDNFSQLMRQAQTVDLSVLEDVDESDVEEFKVYSRSGLSQDPEQFIAAETAKQSKQWQWFVCLFVKIVEWIFAAYVGLLMQTYQAQLNLPLLANDSASTPKQVITAAKKDVCEELLSVCRFVKATELNVRTGAGKKYPVVDTLPFGQGVIIDAFEVNEKDRDWVFINYYDKQSESYQRGWVYRRYLKRYVN